MVVGALYREASRYCFIDVYKRQLIARPRPEGGYEIISGHRRQHAAQLAGLDTLPVIVRNLSLIHI